LLNNNLNGSKIAVFGLAFKPKTDDMREAPSIVIIEQLQKEGANIIAFDPEAQSTCAESIKKIYFLQRLLMRQSGVQTTYNSHRMERIRDLDKDKLKSLMNKPNILDGRNIYEPEEMKKAGFNYLGVGRSC
jgi:UDPglucose 6-dehydrogenase